MKKMMTKIEECYKDTGFGFDVYLLNVPMMKVRGQWTPKINYSELSDKVLRFLIDSKFHLTGEHIFFIRNKLGMTLKEFGHQFGVSHAAVKKWENQKGSPTNMQLSIERDIKMFAEKKAFGSRGLSRVYTSLMTMYDEPISKVELTVEDEERILV